MGRHRVLGRDARVGFQHHVPRTVIVRVRKAEAWAREDLGSTAFAFLLLQCPNTETGAKAFVVLLLYYCCYCNVQTLRWSIRWKLFHIPTQAPSQDSSKPNATIPSTFLSSNVRMTQPINSSVNFQCIHPASICKKKKKNNRGGYHSPCAENQMTANSIACCRFNHFKSVKISTW